MICHQKAKYDLSHNIMFNILVSSVVTDVTESTTALKATPAMVADTISGKRNICKNFINNDIR